MRMTAAYKHMQHIASLGLGEHIAIPEMLSALSDVLPCEFNSFVWLDADQRPRDTYLPPAMSGAFDRYVFDYERLPPGEPTYDKVVGVGHDVGSQLRLHAATDFSESILCREVWRPCGIGCGLDLVLRKAGRAQAILFVHRAADRSRFGAHEHRILRELAPCFQRALGPATAAATAADPREERSGVMVVAADGTILSAGGDAHALMLQMTGLPYDGGMAGIARSHRITPALGDLVRRLTRPRPAMPAGPAVAQVDNARGTFRVRAYAPHPRAAAGGDADTILVLSHHLPGAVHVARSLTSYDLSPRERQVAFLLGLGESADASMAKLGVTIGTWRSYVKRVYQRLDVNSRGEFQAMLLTAG